jgi:hypothetical protein
MADSYELVLVSCLVDSPSDRQQTLSALQCLSGQQVYYLSSLAGAAVDLIVEAAQRQQLIVGFTATWDPKHSPTSIYDHRIVSNEELQSFSQQIQAHYEAVDFDAYIVEESDGDYETRLANQIYRGYAGRIVVLTLPEVIKTCLSLMGVDNAAYPPVFSIWQVQSQDRTTLNTFTATSYEELAVLLFDPQSSTSPPLPEVTPGQSSDLLRNISLTTSVMLEEPRAQPLAVSTLIPELMLEPSSQLEQLFSQEVGQLCEAFTAQLASGAVGASGGQAIGAVNSVLAGIKRQLAKQQEQLEKEAVDLGKENAVLQEVQTEFRAVLEGQNAVEFALSQLSEVLFPAISAVKARISALETIELNARQPVQTSGKLPLTIQAYTTKPDDPCVYLSIASRKLYPVWGYVLIYQAEVLVAESRTPVSFQYLQELNVADISPLPQGQYQAVVAHFLDRSPISNLFPFAINTNPEATILNRNYRYSCVYKYIPNIAEVEAALREQEGDGAVEMLRRLAAQWQNEEQNRAEEFIQIVTRGGGEESIRKSLAERGFQL